MISIRQIPPPIPGRGTTKKIKKIRFGGLGTQIWPQPPCPLNLSGALRGAHDPEKISEIALTVAEKIEFEKKNWRPLAAKLEVVVVTWPNVSNEVDVFYNTWKYEDSRPRNTTLFEFF